MASGSCALLTGEPHDGRSTSFGCNWLLEQRPLRIELRKLVSYFLVGLRWRVRNLVFFQRLDHTIAGEHGRACDDRCRGNTVDARQIAKLDGQLTNQMIESGLAGVIRFAPLLRDNRVRRAGKQQRSGEILVLEHPLEFASM